MQISEEEKKAIAYFKKHIKYFEEQIKFIEATDSDAYDEELEMYENRVKQFNIIINLIEKQNKELEEKETLYQKALNNLVISDKLIDVMAEYIDFEKMNFDCSPLCVRPNCEISCIKEYFRKKVNEKFRYKDGGVNEIRRS